MMLITPAMASDPYSAEAPSFRISTRSIAETGIALMSTKFVVMLSAKGLIATRRPLTSTRVASAPRPRRLIEAAPLAVESWLLPRVENAPLPFEGIFSMSCCRFANPDLSMASRSITSTGLALAKSDERAMRDPVTITVSVGSSADCCARAGAARLVAKTPPMIRRMDCLFIYLPGLLIAVPSLGEVRHIYASCPENGSGCCEYATRASALAIAWRESVDFAQR
jgi:hypothetical protein